MIAGDHSDSGSAIFRNLQVLNEREAAIKHSFMGGSDIREEVRGFIKVTKQDYTTTERVKKIFKILSKS